MASNALVIKRTIKNAVNIDVGRGIIKYIDIRNTNNGHIEIDDRMEPMPMHDYPKTGLSVYIKYIVSLRKT